MEIKFRAWDKEENEMIYDVQDTYDYRCNGSGALEESFATVLIDKERYVVMQYANLKDSQGTELYDGDISVDELGRDWITFATKGGFGICRVREYLKTRNLPSPIIFEGLSEYQNASWFHKNHVIVGNLYEHPQLLDLGGDKK